MKKSKTRKLKVQNEDKKAQFERAEGGQQRETTGKIIYHYIKEEIDKII